ncbi:Uu.00g124080.m01.CDS01 [Anthostomella pinea]|uniref:Uu.00g124080.m01.CDS01 n=1 Tax=Anthostomella pinea TaxID=933095 RepID=A0AAI8VHE9_9PEZI|nr:Uu.00g124080.m01.CDS01 [Anthostomella pinea]
MNGHQGVELHPLPTAATGTSTGTPTQPSSNFYRNGPSIGPSDLDVQLMPWKYVGYKGYAQFVSSDDDLLVLKRFKSLNARVALALQDKVSALEEKLAALDELYSAKGHAPVNNGTLRDDMEDRTSLLAEINNSLYRYNKFLIQQEAVMRFPRAPHRDISNIQAWHRNHDDRAINANELRYLDQEEDLVCLVNKNKTPLGRLIDSSPRMRTLPLWQHRARDVPGYDAPYVAYYSDKRMDAFASGTIFFIGATMLVTPIWVLQALANPVMKLAVITTFVLLFLMVLSFAMVAKPFEALGATAAYAAVLMVFLQLGS